MSTRSKCCIIGIPDHLGVVHVGGRVGAAKGPESFRKIFFRFKGLMNLGQCVKDAGDVTGLTSDIRTNHQQAADFVARHHSASHLSLVIGGGHDHGYSHLQGLHLALTKKKSKLKLGCINIDAHLDVRKPNPLITSGSPFYLAIESQHLNPKNFIEFGIQSHCNSQEALSYVRSQGVRVIPFLGLRSGKAAAVFKRELQALSNKCDAVAISLDLDAAAAAFAPGVSAPQAEGFSPSEIIEMMEIAGRAKKVVSLGIFELNPEHDEGDRTARLAATAAYHFLEGKFCSKLSAGLPVV